MNASQSNWMVPPQTTPGSPQDFRLLLGVWQQLKNPNNKLNLLQAGTQPPQKIRSMSTFDSQNFTPTSASSTCSAFSCLSLSSFSSASSLTSITSTSLHILKQELYTIPSGSVIPLPPPPNVLPRRGELMSLTQRRGYTLSIAFESINPFLTPPKGALEPRVGALPRRNRKKALVKLPSVVVAIRETLQPPSMSWRASTHQSHRMP